jgi:hypothetical protein
MTKVAECSATKGPAAKSVRTLQRLVNIELKRLRDVA